MGTNLTIPLTNSAERWRAYFHPYNDDNFDVKIEVARINRAPTANAGPNRTVSPRASVTLQGSGTDPDSGDTLAYSWEQPAGPTVTLSDTAAAMPTFTAPSSSTTLTFRLTVTDSEGASDTDTVTIRVRSSSSTPDPTPDPEIWGSWSRTGATRGSGRDREAQESRTSNRGNTQTRWVDYPATVPEIWGSWDDTGQTRVVNGERQKQQDRTSSYGRTQTRWVRDSS